MLDYYTSSIISCSIVCVCVGVLVGFELQDLGQFLLIDQTLIPDKLKSGYVGNQSSSKLPRAGLALCKRHMVQVWATLLYICQPAGAGSRMHNVIRWLLWEGGPGLRPGHYG
jgi:hypothetical protein